MTVRDIIKLLADLPAEADVFIEVEGIRQPASEICMVPFVTKIPTNEPDVVLIT